MIVFSINEENVFEKDFFENVVKKDFFNYDKINVEKFEMKINIIKKMFFVVVNFDFVDLKFNFVFVIFAFELISSKIKIKQKKKRDRKSKKDKFVVFFSFFNVHINFHLIDNVRKYTTIMNFNIFVEKIKHV